MIIRLATLDDIPGIMQLIAGVVPVMVAAGNYQWDNTYPNAAVFEADIVKKQLWVADGGGDIAGVTRRNRTGIQLSYRKDFDTFAEFFTNERKRRRRAINWQLIVDNEQLETD